MQANKENIKTWVDALRSGRYSQTKRYLHLVADNGEHAYCCLGVACELAQDAGVQLKVAFQYTELPQGGMSSGSYDGCWAMPPQSVLDWMGVDATEPWATVRNPIGALAQMNDGGASFERIATLIEEIYLEENE